MMNKSKGREYLEEVRERIRYMRERKEKYKERLMDSLLNMSCLSTRVNDDRVQTSNNYDLSDAMAQADELKKSLDTVIKALESYTEKQKEVIRKIEDDDLANILIYRYIADKSDRQIALIVGMTDRGVRKKCVRALTKFEEVYKKS